MLPPAPERRHRHPGRLRVPDRTALAGVLFVLRTGIAWRDVPAEAVGCSGVTAWRGPRDWAEPGVWPRLHSALLTELRRAALTCLTWMTALGTDRTSGPQRGTTWTLTRRPRSPRLQAPPDRRPARNPDRRYAHWRQPTRHRPTPAPARRGSADSGSAGTPRHKPRRLYADRGYDLDKHRRLLWKRGIKPMTARRGVAHGSGLGKVRWVVQRALAWLHQFKRLRTRYEHRADLHQGLLDPACSLICLRRLRTSL